MIIFQRIVTFEAPPDQVVPWAQEITQQVNEKTDFDASLWQGLFGGPLGTLAWSSLVPSLTALEAGMDTLAGDAAFRDLISRAQDWVRTPGQDHLLRMVHSAGGEYVRPDVGAYAEAVRAVPREGKLAKAGAFGVEVADLYSRITHASVLFCTNDYGPYGQLTWLALHENAAAVDNAAEQTAKDEDFTKKLDDADGLFVDGLADRTLARRIL